MRNIKAWDFVDSLVKYLLFPNLRLRTKCGDGVLRVAVLSVAKAKKD